MHHLLANRVVAGINDVDVDMPGVTDGEFTLRNNHFIFTAPFILLGAAHLAASATRSRFDTPQWNYLSKRQIWPVNRSATPPSPPRIMDLTYSQPQLPQNEEVQIRESNNLGAATEETTAFLWIAPPGWNRNVQRGIDNIVIRFTAALARVAAGWATGGVITLPDGLRGGWYGVRAAWVQTTLCRAFRLFFPRAPVIGGKRLRPGHLVSNAIGDIEPIDLPKDELGMWGFFHSFELPTLELYADAAGADTQEGRLWLEYYGDNQPSFQ